MPRRSRQDPRKGFETSIGYSFADVLALTKATRSNLIHWTNTGIIKAEIEDTSGPGHARRFSAFNVIEAELAAVINSFRVPAETIRNGLHQFRSFHDRMVAIHGHVHAVPLVTDPPHLARFRSEDHRRRVANAAATQEMMFAVDGRFSEALAQKTKERLERIANIWWQVRTGTLMKGQPDVAISRCFLGLFLGGMYVDAESRYAYVALDPDNLSQYIEESAIVIDLINVVFQVGKRTHGLGVQPW